MNLLLVVFKSSARFLALNFNWLTTLNLFRNSVVLSGVSCILPVFRNSA